VSESDGKFDVNPTTGQLFVNASLDFETKSIYTFMVSDNHVIQCYYRRKPKLNYNFIYTG
jgi:hypothetical protein